MERIFVYNRKHFDDGVPVTCRLYLGGLDSSKPDEVLKKYLVWYNNDFRLNGYDKVLPFMFFEQFEFVESFCPIDFSDELRNAKIRKDNFIQSV